MNDIRASLRAMQNRVMLTVARTVVSLVNDATKMQSLQTKLLKGEIRDEVERFQNYGFTSVPHAGAEGVVVFVGGNRDHGLCIAVDDRRYRLKSLQPGEVALYTDEGDSVVMKRDREIEFTTETLRINAGTLVEINTPTFRLNAEDTAEIVTPLLAVDAPLATFSGDVQAGGDILDTAAGSGKTMAQMRVTYNGHSHTEQGDGQLVSTPSASM